MHRIVLPLLFLFFAASASFTSPPVTFDIYNFKAGSGFLIDFNPDFPFDNSIRLEFH